MSANELIERLRTLATKEHGFGLRYDNGGFSPSLRLYGKRAVAAYWLLSNGHTAADLLASQAAEIERLEVNAIHSCHDQCTRPLCVLRRENERLREERDEARQAWKDATEGRDMAIKGWEAARQALKGTGADHG